MGPDARPREAHPLMRLGPGRRWALPPLPTEPAATGDVTVPTARDWWLAFEPVHAVVYFDPECLAAMDALGFRGFWMGYIAGRAAPYGPVGPEPVTASFFNFHPDRARRALPDAWAIASPADVWATRSHAAAQALGRVVPGVVRTARARVAALWY